MSSSQQPHGLQPTRLCRPWDSPGKNTGVGCHFLLQCMKVKSESEVAQLRPTLSNPMDCSLPDSFVHGIFQARVLEWGVVPKYPNGALSSHACLKTYKYFMFSTVITAGGTQKKMTLHCLCTLTQVTCDCCILVPRSSPGQRKTDSDLSLAESCI